MPPGVYVSGNTVSLKAIKIRRRQTDVPTSISFVHRHLLQSSVVPAEAAAAVGTAAAVGQQQLLQQQLNVQSVEVNTVGARPRLSAEHHLIMLAPSLSRRHSRWLCCRRKQQPDVNGLVGPVQSP
jgi:hypothetical protein